MRPGLLGTTLGLLVALGSCGGSTSGEPKTAAQATPGGRDHDEPASAEAAPEAEAPPESQRVSCEDGTCSPCGDGICPSGWYCDESAPGGAACSWLKECAEKPSCACVSRVLGERCRCRADGSGLYVTCS